MGCFVVFRVVGERNREGVVLAFFIVKLAQQRSEYTEDELLCGSSRMNFAQEGIGRSFRIVFGPGKVVIQGLGYGGLSHDARCVIMLLLCWDRDFRIDEKELELLWVPTCISLLY